MSQSPMVPKGAGQTEGLSAMFSLFFLLHCETETLMSQTQILPHFGTAEL